MALGPGTRLGAYEILGLLGSGGMGEVYRAKDTKLGREIAIKILPATFTGDPDRVARFRREAQVLASLNHPHIAQIHGLDEANGTQFLVLELVDGESLDKGIARGPIPADEALAVAKQMAGALEAAHEKGVVHRDLKPANIARTRDGAVKVLDFGLAKVADAAGGAALDVANSPTMTTPAMRTSVGMILGTAAYMSPEQAKGKAADKRSDIWAFGCVLFEMLTGAPAFPGEDATEIIAAVVRAEPEWQCLPPATPAAIRRLLKRCLTKDPRERLHDIADARLEIVDAQVERPESAVLMAVPSRRRFWVAAALAGVVAVVASLLVIMRPPARQEPVYRATIVLPSLPLRRVSTEPRGTGGGLLALSPDGRKLAFVAPGPEGRPVVWVRRLDTDEPRPLAGTDDATAPFWSADGNQIGFTANLTLKRVSESGGAVLTLAEGTARGSTGAWNSDGVILFAGSGRQLLRISASGGATSPVTTAEPADASMRPIDPAFLPDGTHFTYRVVSGASQSRVYVGSLGSTTTKLLLDDVANAVYASGFLLFVRGASLIAQRFDERRLELNGEPRTIAERVRLSGPPFLSGMFAVSQTGVVTYQEGDPPGSELVWFDRSGRQQTSLADRGEFNYVQLSPDGRQAAVTVADASSKRDIWLYDVARGARTRFTSDPADDFSAVWSPDGSRLIWAASRQGSTIHLYQKQSSGNAAEARIDEDAGIKIPTSWSPDGRFLLYQTEAPNADMWTLPLAGNRTPSSFRATRFNESAGQFSPDGRWIAYNSSDTGRPEVYVAPFQREGLTVPISIGGGAWPRWRRDGKELFYLAEDNALMAVAVSLRESTVEVGSPRQLFRARFRPGSFPYDVTADGQGFLVNRSVDDSSSPPITLVINWPAALAK